MIPKKIHYCWFGRGNKPELALKCIDSWNKYLPEYEIKEWNEDNFDLDMYPYVREAYDNRKFAFVTDVVRLYALYMEGGVYMDTDVEVLKPLDSILEYDAVSGFESETLIPTGLMGSRKGATIIKELLDEYNGLHFIKENGEFDLTTNVTRITKILLRHGLKQNNTKQTVGGYTLLPSDYLCPKSYIDGKIYLTENSLCIHHFSGSWKSEEELWSKKMSEKYIIIPTSIRGYIFNFIAYCKFRGFSSAVKDTFTWAKRKSSGK